MSPYDPSKRRELHRRGKRTEVRVYVAPSGVQEVSVFPRDPRDDDRAYRVARNIDLRESVHRAALLGSLPPTIRDEVRKHLEDLSLDIFWAISELKGQWAS